ncbi:antiviral reverse transcriptase Drt3a [Fictibacillus sp. 26RED30]|uniref:antiviral reverse transcriptase Drt3a n=1 Tax=Fictibacillus sp. 26RED30 TaxID=2745877 RepID=UPI0018CE53E8|nr:antiviral reverse transcriptase Drt3a [Fictibacillus sp. 26RED30]MBH0163198.1 hypothetical protein [Fictibacillus sp. 26RED30]
MKHKLTKDLLRNYYSSKYDQLKTGNDRISPKQFNKIKEDEFNLILKKISNGTYKFTSLREVSLPSNRLVVIPTIRDRLVLEYLKDRIKQKYRITFPNRDDIIQSILLKFEFKLDYYIIRLDIKKFFDTIPQHILLGKIKEKSLLSSQEYYILKELFKKVDKGLPQGISISNVLSEIYMKVFDEEMKHLNPKINYYSRYVDDILFIINGQLTKKEITELKNRIDRIFKHHHLQLNNNDAKYKFTIFPLNSKNNDTINCFKYLGYEFKVQNKKLSISVTQEKLDKYLEKIVFCFNEFKSNRNLELLISRLDFLTKKNAVIKKEQFITKNKEVKYRKKRICFGFAENYKYISMDEKNKVTNYVDDLIIREINNVKNILNSKFHAYSNYDKKRLYSISLKVNMHKFNAIYKYKKLDYIRKLISINPVLTQPHLSKYSYKELSKMFFYYLKYDYLIR